MDPTAGLDGCGEENILPPPGVEHRTVQPVTTTPLVLDWLDMWGLLPESPPQVNCLNNDLNYLLSSKRATISQYCTYAGAAAVAVLLRSTLHHRYPKHSIITFMERYAELAISLESISIFLALWLNVHGDLTRHYGKMTFRTLGGIENMWSFVCQLTYT